MNNKTPILFVAALLGGFSIVIVLAQNSMQVRRDTCEQRGGVEVKTYEGAACIKAEVLK